MPEIVDGDKRVLLIAGEPVPYALARIPKPGETRGNLAAGGRGEARPLTAREREIAAALGPALWAEGLLVVGLDVIGDCLTEVNVTSPTCFVEIARADRLRRRRDVRRCAAARLRRRSRPAARGRRRARANIAAKSAADAPPSALPAPITGHALIGILIIAHDTPRRQPGAGGHARARHAARRSSRCCRSPPTDDPLQLLPARARAGRAARHRRGRADLLRHLRRDAVQPRLQAAAAGPRRGRRRRQPADAGARVHLSQQGHGHDDQEGHLRRLRRRAAHRSGSRSMQQREVEIVNKLGLHARASAKLTQLAAKYQCDVCMSRNGAQRQRQEHHGRDDAGGGQGRAGDARDRRARRGRGDGRARRR